MRAIVENNKKDYNLLKSIPGIGGYLASVILAECGDLRRFITKTV
jgi:transposase